MPTKCLLRMVAPRVVEAAGLRLRLRLDRWSTCARRKEEESPSTGQPPSHPLTRGSGISASCPLYWYHHPRVSSLPSFVDSDDISRDIVCEGWAPIARGLGADARDSSGTSAQHDFRQRSVGGGAESAGRGCPTTVQHTQLLSKTLTPPNLNSLCFDDVALVCLYILFSRGVKAGAPTRVHQPLVPAS